MPRLALKVDVDTLRGTRDGVPRLARLFRRVGADATFFFSVGPDHTGRALRRVFQRGFLAKVSRTSVLEHYGLRTLLYGTLLPGPDIGRCCACELRAIQADGFEVGLHAYDHVKWQDYVAQSEEEWTGQEMRRGIDRFEAIFRERPRIHAAAGWQMNASAFQFEDGFAFDYASDTRGTHPFLPIVSGNVIKCPQLPTTLPTLDELIGTNGITPQSVAAHLVGLTAKPAPCDHVFTLHAELEGLRLLPVLATLLAGWIAQGYTLVSMRALFESLDAARLPCHQAVAAPFPGRTGALMCQGPHTTTWRGPHPDRQSSQPQTTL